MKTECTSRLTSFNPRQGRRDKENHMRIRKIALVFGLFAAVATATANAQTTVFVPGNASGFFGTPVNQMVALVPAITVSGPATITVTYVSGTVNYGISGVEVGPNGGRFFDGGVGQSPLQEARAFAPHTPIDNMAALIGIFVPQSRVQQLGFSALDGTKNVTRVGINPWGLFFVGESKTFTVNMAGTLFLGINDSGVSDNSGGFNVEVSAQ
jgi:hypothetical protein